MLGGPAAARARGREATKTKIAVVTHGDTGSFWSVFKKGVDQAAEDLKGRGVSVTQVYANNDVSKQVSGINAAIAVEGQRHRDVGAGRERAQGSAHEGSRRRASRSSPSTPASARSTTLPTYEVHVGQTEEHRRRGRRQAVQRRRREESVVVVIHEASNSGLTQRAAGRKKTFKGTTKTLVDPEREVGHPWHAGEDHGVLQGEPSRPTRCSGSTRT